MGLTNFPNGVTSFGVPVMPGTEMVPFTANVFFVDSDEGADVPSAGTADYPFATIDYAIGKCTAGQGDTIFVCPDHTETIKAAGSITCDVAGVTIIGVGRGKNMPTLTYSTATTATVLVTAANVTFKNIYFNGTGIDAIAKMFDVQAAGFTLDSCEVYFAKTGAVCIKGLVCDTAAHANNLTINNCYIHGDAAANCTNFVQLVGGDSVKITNNIIQGNFTTNLGCINNITAALTNYFIDGNRLWNNTAVSTKVIVLLTGSTGWITNNRVGILNGTAPFTADAGIVGGNYYAAAVGVSAATLV